MPLDFRDALPPYLPRWSDLVESVAVNSTVLTSSIPLWISTSNWKQLA